MLRSMQNRPAKSVGTLQCLLVSGPRRGAGLWARMLFLACLALPMAGANEVRYLKLHDEVICRVNTQVISKRDVEGRLIGKSHQEILRLFAYREQMEAAGRFDEEAEKKFNEIYMPSFHDELRDAIKEKLMLQEAKILKMEVDKSQFQQRYQQKIEELKRANQLHFANYTLSELKEKLHEIMLLEEFRGQFLSVLDKPNKPEIEAYYQKHISEYQRPAGVKLLQIVVDFKKSDVFGNVSLRKDAAQFAEEVRKKIVEDGEDFALLAGDEKTNDEGASRQRGGLLVGANGDEFLSISDLSQKMAKVVQGLKPEDPVSRVFDYGERGFAIIKLMARREAGPRPLDGKLIDELRNSLLQQKFRQGEEAWFRKAVEKSMILVVIDGKETKAPTWLLFPNDKPPQGTGSGKVDAPKTAAKP